MARDVPTNARTFVGVAQARPRGGMAVRIPFDPSAEWGVKGRHDVTGSVAGRKVRGRLVARRGEYYLDTQVVQIARDNGWLWTLARPPTWMPHDVIPDSRDRVQHLASSR